MLSSSFGTHKTVPSSLVTLKLKEPFYAKNFYVTMRCVKSKVAMSFENNKDKIYGFQFHPESFLTENGNIIIKKILSS